MPDTTPRTPLEELRRVVYDKGRAPQHHDEIMRRHRKEWPALWRAIDALLAAPSGEPIAWKVACPVCEGRGQLREAMQAWDVPGAPVPECPHCDEGVIDLTPLLAGAAPAEREVRTLIDEAERILLAEQDEGRDLPHLRRALDGAKQVWGAAAPREQEPPALEQQAYIQTAPRAQAKEDG